MSYDLPAGDPSTTDFSSLLRPALANVHAYSAPRPSGLIYLDAMESPYSLPPDLVAHLAEIVRALPLHRYPDATATALKQQLRNHYSLPENLSILLGNGSDEILQILMMALKPGATVMAPEPGFVMYRHLAHCCGLEYVALPLDENFQLPLARTLALIARHQPQLIFIADPNNPTGSLFDTATIEAILAHAPGLVVMDEAYQPYCDRHWLFRAGGRHLVCRTLSKVGLAGLRLGMLFGEESLINTLEKLRLPYNISAFTQAAASLLLQRSEILYHQVAQTLQERTRLLDQLQTWPQVKVWPSAANFLCLRVPDALHAYQGLRRGGVLVKNLHGSHPLLQNCLRTTIGSARENDLFMALLRTLV